MINKKNILCGVLLFVIPVQVASFNVDLNDGSCDDSTGVPFCSIQAVIGVFYEFSELRHGDQFLIFSFG